VAAEERVLLHADDHVQVARRPARGSRLALARDPELAARVDARRDLHVQLALHGQLSLAAAVLARVRDDAAGPAAAPAGAGDAEEPLLERDLAAASARGAGRGLGARGRARAVADRAVLGPWDLQRGLGAESRLLERQLEVVAQVGPAARPPA